MTTLHAIRTRDLPDAEIARLLARRYRDLTDADPENVQARIDNLKTPSKEAVRRLQRKS